MKQLRFGHEYNAWGFLSRGRWLTVIIQQQKPDWNPWLTPGPAPSPGRWVRIKIVGVKVAT